MSQEIVAPAGFVPLLAMAFGGGDASAVAVDGAHPLPVVVARAASPTALVGTLGASGVAGPFVPVRDRPIWVTLTGNWTGTATLKRSVDGGATRLPLTVAGSAWASFTGNANEPIGEESAAEATYYLDAALTGGALTYRVAQ